MLFNLLVHVRRMFGAKVKDERRFQTTWMDKKGEHCYWICKVNFFLDFGAFF